MWAPNDPLESCLHFDVYIVQSKPSDEGTDSMYGALWAVMRTGRAKYDQWCHNQSHQSGPPIA